jgi:hypothetical protein
LRRHWMALGLICLGVLWLPSPAFPQSLVQSSGRALDPEGYAAPGWSVNLGLAGTNALLSGTVVSLHRWVRGESLGTAFREGFGPGALTGVLTYAGKRIAVESFWGAGLLGRQIHGAGASSARSLSAGGGFADDLNLFLGPVRVRITDSSEDGGARWRVSGLDTYWLIYGIADSRFSMDWERSLSSGAPVFRPDRGRRIEAPSGERIGGAALGGVIFLSDGLGEEEESLLRHERVHVMQFDYLHTLVSQPLELAALRRLRGDREEGLLQHIEERLYPDLLILGFGALLGTSAESRRAPWEVEAYLLERRP